MTETTTDLKSDLLRLYYSDRVAFCRSVLPHWFSKPMPWFHRGILAIITQRPDFLLNFGEEQWADGTSRWTKKKLAKLVRNFTYPLDPENPQSPRLPIFKIHYKDDGRTPASIEMTIGLFTNLIIPRGFSKTTITKAALLSMILFEETQFSVYIGKSEREAKAQIGDIRGELEGNERILLLWGNLRPERIDSEKWTDGEFETNTGVVIVAKGWDSQIRGLIRNSVRPDFMALDDIQDDDIKKSEDLRVQGVSKYKATVEPARRRIGVLGRIVNLATVLHPDALAMTMAKDPRFTTIQFGAIDSDGEALWEDQMSLRQLEQERLSFQRIGKLYEFGMEYLSSINVADKLSFKAENIQRYRLYQPEEFISAFPVRALVVDPAISQDPKADYCAFAVVGMSERGRFHVAQIHLEQGMMTAAQVDKYFELSTIWDCNKHGVESIAYQTALIHILREEMFRKKRYFEIEPIKHGRKDGSKIERVEAVLQVRYHNQLITHNERWDRLERMFFDWPYGKKDGPDAIAMAITLCDPFAAFAHDDPEELLGESPTLPPLPASLIEWAP